jgi:hypothetical protein
METFSIVIRAVISIAIDDFGSEKDKILWDEWASKYPETKPVLVETIDYSNVPMEPDLRDAIILCLRRSFDHVHQQTRSPLNKMPDMSYFVSKMNRLYTIAAGLSPTRLEWPSSLTS